MAARSPTHREVLGIAVPIMLSNVTTPLIGVVDTAVVGQLPDPAYIGAVALGSLVFSFVFWAFGFLRMGTTGFTAQAVGRGDDAEVRHVFARALIVALGAGVFLLVAQWPIREIAFFFLEGSEEVESLGRRYFDVRMWSAPAALANYAILGWFIGRGRARVALALQLILNVTNMALDALFVLRFGWGVEGVAYGTVFAEVFAAVVGLGMVALHLGELGGRWSRAAILDPARLRRTIAVNFDIMVRSLSLLFVFVFIMAKSAEAGDVILAANAILFHFISVAAYFLDGLAFAAEAHVGRAIGARAPDHYRLAVRRTTAWAAGIALLASLLLVLMGPLSIDLLTVDPAVREAARVYLPWAAAGPIVGVWCFQLDGIFIGATRGPEMRNGMLAATAIFIVGWWLLTPWGNHGLWASLFVHYAARTGMLLAFLPRIGRDLRTLEAAGGGAPASR